MNFIKMIRKFVKILIGGSGSKEIYLAFLFGIILGLIPGFNLTTTILIFLIILINVNLGTAVLAFLLGELLMFLIAPLTYSIGYSLIHTAYLTPFFETLVNAPVLALLGFDNYCQVGGIIIGIIIGLFFAWIFTYLVQILRKALLVTSDKKTISRIAGNPIVKLLLRIIFGKPKKNIEETLKNKSKLIRKGFFYPLIVFIIILVIADLFLISPIAKKLIISNTESLIGAEVNINNLDLSVFRGKLKIEKMQITDSTNPQNNLVYVDNIDAQLSITELLAKRIVADKAIFKGAAFDTKRTKPGKVYSQVKIESPTLNLPDLKDDRNDKASVGTNILDKIKKYEKYIETVQKYYKIASENYQALRKSTTTAKKSKKHVDLLSSTATELKKKYPTILFKEIAGDSTFPYPLDIKLFNISSEPELVQAPVKVFVTPKNKQTNPEIELVMKTTSKSDYIDISIKEVILDNVKIADGLPSLKRAKTDINTKGSFNMNHLELPCMITLNDLQMDKKVHSGINLNSLDKLTLYFNIVGSIDKINIIPDHDKNTQNIKNILAHGTKKILEDNLNNIMPDNDNVKDIKNKVFDIFK